MFNGYSGYFPPLYIEFSRKLGHQPVAQSISDLNYLCIDYLILHRDRYSEQLIKKITYQLDNRRGDVQFIQQIGNAYIYRIKDCDPDRETLHQ